MLELFRALWSMFDRRERRNALILLMLMLGNGLLELVGIASVVPLIAVLSDPSVIQRNALLNRMYVALGYDSTVDFLFLLSFITFILTATRALFSMATSYATVRFAQERARKWSVSLLKIYLARTYSWFITRNTSELGKTILSETDGVVQHCLLPTLNLTSQSIVCIFILGLIIYAEPYTAATVSAIIGGIYGIVYFSSRRLFSRIGEDLHNSNSLRFTLVQEILGGIKEIKVARVERAYVGRFDKAARVRAKRSTQRQLLKDIPRSTLELVAIGGVLVFILILLWRSDSELRSILPTLALYVFAGTRLMPAMQRVFQDIVHLRSSAPTLLALRDELRYPEISSPAPAAKIVLKDAIDVRCVSYSFPESGKPALSNVSLRLPAHTITAIVGASGSGKSTLLDNLLGILTPQSGSILLDGRPLSLDNTGGWQSSIGYVPQQIFMLDDTISANIAFGRAPHDGSVDAAIERAAKLAMIHEFICGELADGYDTRMGDRGIRLSGGQRQRVGIARALFHDPSVLVLDEATSALDPATEQQVVGGLIRLKQTQTIILVTHRIASVKLCDNIVLMNKGEVRAVGTYDELMATEQVFRDLASPQPVS